MESTWFFRNKVFLMTSPCLTSNLCLWLLIYPRLPFHIRSLWPVPASAEADRWNPVYAHWASKFFQVLHWPKDKFHGCYQLLSDIVQRVDLTSLFPNRLQTCSSTTTTFWECTQSVTEAKSAFGYIAIKKMPAPCNAKLFHWGVFGTGNWEVFEYEKL